MTVSSTLTSRTIGAGAAQPAGRMNNAERAGATGLNWRGTRSDDIEHGRLWPDMREQAVRPSPMRVRHDLDAVDDRCRFDPETIGSRIIAGPGSLDSMRRVDWPDYQACKAFVDATASSAYRESPTMRRLLNHAMEHRLRDACSRWLLEPSTVFATTTTDEQILNAGNRRVLLVDLPAIQEADSADCVVYASAAGEQALDPFRACVHELVHIATGLPDGECKHPRGPVVEYTNKILKECGHSSAARTSYLQGADESSVESARPLEAAKGNSKKAAGRQKKPVAVQASTPRLLVEGEEYKNVDEILKELDADGVRPTDGVTEETLKVLIEQNVEYDDVSLLKNEIRMRRHLVQIMRESGDLKLDYNHGKEWLSLPEAHWKGVPLFDEKGPALPPSEGKFAGFQSKGKPSDAIEAIFDTGRSDFYYLECNTMAQSMHYYALLKTIGAERFDKHFSAGIKIIPEWLSEKPGGNPHQSPFPVSEKVEEIEQLLPGDWVYFVNHADYSDRHPEGAFAGEHSFYMGGHRYQGFGVEIKSHANMIKTLDDAYNARSDNKGKKSKLISQNRPSPETFSGTVPGIVRGQVRRFTDNDKISRLLTEAPERAPTPPIMRARIEAENEQRGRTKRTDRGQAPARSPKRSALTQSAAKEAWRDREETISDDAEPLSGLGQLAALMIDEPRGEVSRDVVQRLSELIPSLNHRLLYVSDTPSMKSANRDANLHFNRLFEQCILEGFIKPAEALRVLMEPILPGNTRYPHTIARYASTNPGVASALIDVLSTIATKYVGASPGAEWVRSQLSTTKDAGDSNFYSLLASASGGAKGVAAALLFDGLEPEGLLPSNSEIRKLKSSFGAGKLILNLFFLRKEHGSESASTDVQVPVEKTFSSVIEAARDRFGAANVAGVKRESAEKTLRKSLYAIDCCSPEEARLVITEIVTEALKLLKGRYAEHRSHDLTQIWRRVQEKLQEKAAPIYQQAMRRAYQQVREAGLRSAMKAFDAAIAQGDDKPDWDRTFQAVTDAAKQAYRKTIADTRDQVAADLQDDTTALVMGQGVHAFGTLGATAYRVDAAAGPSSRLDDVRHGSGMQEKFRIAFEPDVGWAVSLQATDVSSAEAQANRFNGMAADERYELTNMLRGDLPDRERLKDEARNVTLAHLSEDSDVEEILYAARVALREAEEVEKEVVARNEAQRRTYQAHAEEYTIKNDAISRAIAAVSAPRAGNSNRKAAADAEAPHAWPDVPTHSLTPPSTTRRIRARDLVS